MPDDYDAMARVLRALVRASGRKRMLRSTFEAASALSPDRAEAAFKALRERGWIDVDVRTVALGGDGYEYAGKNAGQLLALDIVAWIKLQSKEAFEVRELPPNYRASWPLLVLAVEDLVRANVVGPKAGGDISDETVLVTKASLEVYEFGSGVPLASVSVQHHSGHHAGRDVIVNTGSGVVQTGDHSVANVNADAARSFGLLLESLRKERDITEPALDVLQRVAEPGSGHHEVAGIVADAAERDPRLVDRVRAWLSGLPGHLARATLVEGIKLYLKTNHVIP